MSYRKTRQALSISNFEVDTVDGYLPCTDRKCLIRESESVRGFCPNSPQRLAVHMRLFDA